MKISLRKSGDCRTIGSCTFTLIELLVSATCKTEVLWAKTHKKTDASDASDTSDTSDSVFSKKQRQGSKEFCGSKTFDPNQKFLKGSVGFQGSEGGRKTFLQKSFRPLSGNWLLHFNRTPGRYRHYCDFGGDAASGVEFCPGKSQNDQLCQ